MSLTIRQQRALAVLPKLTGGLSLLSSGMIAYLILQNPKKRCKAYHQFILGMAVADMSSSFWLALSTWPIPQDSGAIWAVGNATTCQFQGFFTQFGISSPLYNVSLSVYYVLTIRYNWKDYQLLHSKAKILRMLHILPLGWAIATALAGLGLDLFHSANLWCWIASNQDGTNNANLYRWILFYGPLWLGNLLVTCNLLLVFQYVRTITLRSEQYYSSNNYYSNFQSASETTRIQRQMSSTPSNQGNPENMKRGDEKRRETKRKLRQQRHKLADDVDASIEFFLHPADTHSQEGRERLFNSITYKDEEEAEVDNGAGEHFVVEEDEQHASSESIAIPLPNATVTSNSTATSRAEQLPLEAQQHDEQRREPNQNSSSILNQSPRRPLQRRQSSMLLRRASLVFMGTNMFTSYASTIPPEAAPNTPNLREQNATSQQNGTPHLTTTTTGVSMPSTTTTTTPQHPLAQKRQQVANQCLRYALAFYLTWIPITLVRILQTLNPPQSVYGLLVWAAMATPCQGLPNFIIYLYPTYLRHVEARKRLQQQAPDHGTNTPSPQSSNALHQRQSPTRRQQQNSSFWSFVLHDDDEDDEEYPQNGDHENDNNIGEAGSTVRQTVERADKGQLSREELKFNNADSSYSC